MAIPLRIAIAHTTTMHFPYIPFSKAYQKMYLQSTLTLIRFDTVGGTELAAIHKYAPISSLDILDISNVSPSHSVTIKTVFISTQKSSIKLFGCCFFLVRYQQVIYLYLFWHYRIFST